MPINLLYHDVTAPQAENSSGFPGPGAARYKLTTDEFELHLDQIAKTVHQPPLSSTSLDAFDTPHADAWTITFDDGGVSAITEIAGRLEQRGWRGWFFITTDLLDTPTFCSRAQVQDLHRRGHVIGSHSCSHPERISRCSWPQLLDEWTRSCQILSQLIESPIIAAAVPGGFYSKQVARAAAVAGIRILFNSEPTTITFPVEEIRVLGRYNIYRGMTAEDAALLVKSPFRRLRQTAFWNVKKVAKTLVGPLYKSIRQKVLSRNYDESQ